METEKNKNGKDRGTTENNILQALEQLIEEDGFENLGINAIAERAGISKILIYRYFESLEGLIAAYIKRHDFWINFSPLPPAPNDIEDFIKNIFHQQIRQLRDNKILNRLYRWELSSQNPIINTIRQQREEKGLWLIQQVCQATQRQQEDTAIYATLLSSCISYLALLEDQCPEFNGIPLQKEEGWQKLESGIDRIIEQWVRKTK